MNKILVIFFLLLMVACNSVNCYTIREWEVFSINGNKKIITDTIGQINGFTLDTLIDLKIDESFTRNGFYYVLEASHIINLDKDSIKIFRIVKNGNLTIFYCKKYGEVMLLSPIERKSLSKLENSCTKQIVNTKEIYNLIKNDTILCPLSPDKGHNILFN